MELSTKELSYIDILFSMESENCQNDMQQIKLVIKPIPKNGVGSLVRVVVDPQATPPAMVTYINWFIYIFFFPKVQKSSAPTVLPTKEKIVLLITTPLPH